MNNYAQNRRFGSDFYGRFADVFPIGVKVQRSPGFHAQVRGVEVIYFAEAEMAAKVDGRMHASLKGSMAAIDADIELAIIHLRARRNPHATPSRDCVFLDNSPEGSIGEAFAFSHQVRRG